MLFVPFCEIPHPRLAELVLRAPVEDEMDFDEMDMQSAQKMLADAQRQVQKATDRIESLKKKATEYEEEKATDTMVKQIEEQVLVELKGHSEIENVDIKWAAEVGGCTVLKLMARCKNGQVYEARISSLRAKDVDMNRLSKQLAAFFYAASNDVIVSYAIYV